MEKPTVEVVTRMSYTMTREQIEEAIKTWIIKNHAAFRGAEFDFDDITDDVIEIRAEKRKTT